MNKIIFLAAMIFFSVIMKAQVGNVGINTTNPLAMLHIKDSSALFQGGTNVAANPGNPPISGGGVRMMWYPDKSAFRVGRVSSDDWNKDSIGNYSFATGNNTKAKGVSSVAFGSDTHATGENSTAFGTATIASGFRSTSFGTGTRASGGTSTAFGNSTIANGGESTAMGSFTTASGLFSTAMGRGSMASGTISTAMGQGTRASGYTSTSIGHVTTALAFASFSIGQYNDSIITSNPSEWINTDPVFIIGNGMSNNNRSNAFVVNKNGNAIISGEVQRPSTGSANLVPICYGSISSAAGINGGTGNFSVNNSATGVYEITITGETYTNTGYMTIVTAIGGAAFRVATTGAQSGNLVIRIFDVNGALTSNTAAFSFVVYKP